MRYIYIPTVGDTTFPSSLKTKHHLSHECWFKIILNIRVRGVTNIIPSYHHNVLAVIQFNYIILIIYLYHYNYIIHIIAPRTPSATPRAPAADRCSSCQPPPPAVLYYIISYHIILYYADRQNIIIYYTDRQIGR